MAKKKSPAKRPAKKKATKKTAAKAVKKSRAPGSSKKKKAPAKKEPARRGRPPTEITPQMLETLATLKSVGVPDESVAGILQISIRTFYNLKKSSPDFLQAIQRGEQAAIITLCDNTMHLSRKSAAVNLYMRKRLLGERDDHGTQTGRAVVVVPAAVPAEEWNRQSAEAHGGN